MCADKILDIDNQTGEYHIGYGLFDIFYPFDEDTYSFEIYCDGEQVSSEYPIGLWTLDEAVEESLMAVDEILKDLSNVRARIELLDMDEVKKQSAIIHLEEQEPDEQEDPEVTEVTAPLDPRYFLPKGEFDWRPCPMADWEYCMGYCDKCQEVGDETKS